MSTDDSPDEPRDGAAKAFLQYSREIKGHYEDTLPSYPIQPAQEIAAAHHYIRQQVQDNPDRTGFEKHLEDVWKTGGSRFEITMFTLTTYRVFGHTKARLLEIVDPRMGVLNYAQAAFPSYATHNEIRGQIGRFYRNTERYQEDVDDHWYRWDSDDNLYWFFADPRDPYLGNAPLLETHGIIDPNYPEKKWEFADRVEVTPYRFDEDGLTEM